MRRFPSKAKTSAEARRLQAQVHTLMGSMEGSLSVVASRFGTSRNCVAYWRKRFKDPSWHGGSLGGARNVVFPDVVLLAVQLLLWYNATEHPLSTLQEHRQFVHSAVGLWLSRQYVGVIFKSWRWSFKRPSIKQAHKYKASNILYYTDFCVGVGEIPWAKLKFLDEAHFRSKGTSLFV